ncbi:Fe-S oxidoreductase [Desulfocucumis palustris]|uniref:Fe-S oxidoreductase n=1 Tax=Desulfocucumis palustris TaxID=1898651 RepID=A0A2L2XL98_9FIRM|nr:DUF1987 domain-containing protein [Desulfocucumis palustris]GBF34721.1 Fe-S oxidoreductase [Desulfocucumis palustris]
MEKLIIEKTKSSPYIFFNPEERLLKIYGESFPENAAKFYAPVLDWVKDYLEQLDGQEVNVEMEIIYFNSSTSKVFMNFFQMLDDAAAEGNKITINWRCHEENEAAIECGEEFMEDLENVPFNIMVFKGE